MRGIDSRKGFTLVELMVSLGIFAMLMAAVYTVLSISDSTTQTGLTSIELSQDARLGIDYMLKELHNARRSTISIPDGSSITFQVLGSSNIIQYSLGGLNGIQLIRSEAGTNTVLCNNVQSIQFSPSPFSGRVISIDLQTRKTSLSRRNLTRTLNVRVKVRN